MRRAVFHDPELQRQFDYHGYLVLPCLPPDEVEALRDGWFRAEAEIHRWGFSASIMSDDRQYRDAVSDAIGAAYARSLDQLLVDYRFVFGNYLTKIPHTAAGIPLHQDFTFVDEDRFESINFWIALVDVEPANGCLRVMPGSQNLNAALRGTDRRFPYPELEQTIESRYLVDVPMPAGSACIMSQRLFHTSYPNASDGYRIAASALAVPQESTLYYPYQDFGSPNPEIIHLVEVDDAFYRYQVFGAPPVGRPLVSRTVATKDPLTVERLEAAYVGPVLA